MKRHNTSFFNKMVWTAVAAVLAIVAFFAVGFTASAVESHADAAEWTLTEVAVEQNPGYIFTRGQKAENLRHIVTVTATYKQVASGDGGDDTAVTDVPTERRVLEYKAAAGEDSFTAVTGETVELVLSGTTLSVKVTAPAGGNYSGSADTTETVTLKSESEKTQVGIYAQYLDNYVGELTTASVLSPDNFAVYAFYNNGFPGGEDDRLIGAAYNVSGNLFPNTPLTDNFDTGADTYETYVEITTNGTPRYTANARVTGIKFDKPKGVGSISGTFKTQTALSELDITGINVALKYFSSYNVPLKLFPKSSYTCRFYANETDAAQEKNELDGMVVSAKWCIIEFEYPGVGTGKDPLPITVSPISIHTPKFPTYNALDFYSGVSVDITDLDYSGELSGVQPVIDVTVGDGKKEYGSEYYVFTPQNEKHVFNIEFKKPNIPYVITLSLENSENGGNYQWGAAQTNVTRENFTLTYTIQIEKSIIKLTDLNGLTVEWEYGKTYAGGPNIKGTILNAESTQLEFKYTEDPSLKDFETDGTVYGYYHLEYWDDKTGTYVKDAPKQAGKYKAVAVTHETDVWKSSFVYEPNNKEPFILTVTVTPVKIDPNNILFAPQVTYDRDKEYDKENILSDEKNKFVDENGVMLTALPLDITFKDSSEAEQTTLKYAGTYTVSLKLTDGNFIFTSDGTVPDEYYTAETKPGRTAEKPFSIDRLVITPTANAEGWTYGDGVSVSDKFSSGLAANLTKYATVGAASFYDDLDAPIEETDLAKWSAGDYYVVYSAVYNGSDDAEKNSCVFNTARADLTVAKKTLLPVLAVDNGTYDHAEHTIAIGGYEYKNGDKNVIKKTVTFNGAAYTANEYSDDFTVKNAGEYIVTFVSTNPNYRFADGFDGTLAYTVNKAVATLSQKQSNKTFDDTAENKVQALPEFADLLINGALNRKLSASELAISWKITDESGESVGSITAAGVYTFTFTVTGGADKDNYELEQGLEYVYTIDSAKIKAPDATFVLSANYNGKFRSPSEFISDWDTYYGGYKLVFSVTAIDGLTDADGKRMRNAGTYTIVVLPAASFEWEDDVQTEDGGVLTYTFTINKLAVELDWTVTETVYGGLQKPTVEITNVQTDDNGARDEVGVTFDKTGVTAAGEYVFTVNGLDGAENNNYTLTGTDASTLTGNFTVYKKTAVAPHPDKTFTTEFDGASHTETVFGDYDKDLFDVELTAKRPMSWFDGGAADMPFTDEVMNFDAATGEFTYRNAGVYTIVFTIKAENKANYCVNEAGKADFTSSGDYYSATVTAAEITRKTVNAPSFGNDRAMEYDKYTTAIADILDRFKIAEKLTTLVVAYGRRDADGGYNAETETSTQLGGNAPSDIDQYYAVLSLGDDKYNYIWGNVEKDYDDGYFGLSFIYGNRVAEISYTETNGARVNLHYAVTARQVDLSLTVNGYDFGDNGVGTVDENGKNFRENTNRTGTEKVFAFKGENETADIKIEGVTYVFKKNGAEIESAALVNGLPWEKGEYEVGVIATFTNSAYQPWTTTAALTVSAREVTVEWKYFDGENKQVSSGLTVGLVYKGGAYEFVPVIMNIPVKTSDTESIVVPELTVEQSGLTNAGDDLWIKATAVDDENYIANGENTKLSVIIERAVLGVEVSAAEHTYGESLGGYTKNFTIVSGTIYDRDSKNIVATRIEDGNGNIVTNSLDAKVGVPYYIVPYINESELGSGNYTLGGSPKQTFTVKPRTITVTVDQSKAKSVYGTNGANLNDPSLGIFSVSTLPDGANAVDVFTLVTEVEITASTPVKDGGYIISCNLIDTVNYTLTPFGEYHYTVENARLTVSGELSDYSGTYNAAKHNILPAAERAKVVSVDNSSVAWYYFDGADWKPLENLSLIGACERTEYRLKAQAANHEDKEFAIWAEVQKATLTVTIKFDVYYGEVSDWSDNFNYKTELSDLRDKNTGIYSVSGFADSKDESDFYAARLSGFGGSFGYAYADSVTPYVRGDGAGGSYALVFVGANLESDNYVFTGGGALCVSKLPVTVKLDKSEYKASYGDPVAPVITVTTTALSVRGGTISLDELTEAYTAVNGALDESGKTNSVGVYDVTVSPTDNYEFTEITVPYEITIATNGFTGGYSLFVGDNTTSVTTNSIPYAWTYGDRAGDNPDGYDPAAGAKNDINAVNIVGWENSLTVTIDLVGLSGTLNIINVEGTLDTITETLKNAFSDAWRGKAWVAAETNAYYRAYYRMKESHNYAEFTHAEYFKIKKAALTVKPSNVNTVYGEAAAYGVEFSGFVLNGGEREDLSAAVGAEYVSVVKQASRWNITGYDAGDDAGVYETEITDIDGQNAEYFVNYEFVYGKGSVTVAQRKMLVTVNNANNRYMFIGKYNSDKKDYDKDPLAELDVTVHAEDGYYGYYGNEIPFEIKTSARFVTADGKDATKDAGEYTIYLVFKDGKYANNYSIEFKDCAMPSSADDVNAIKFGDANNAGKYTVTAAQIRMDVTGPYYKSPSGEDVLYGEHEGGIYDGREKFFVARPVYGSYDVPNKNDITFGAVYYRTEGDKSESLGDGVLPKNVGSYSVRFFSTGGNKNFEEIDDDGITKFGIAYKQVTAAPNVTEAVYNGQSQKFTVKFNGLIQGENMQDLNGVTVEIAAAELQANKDAGLAHKNLQSSFATEGNNVSITAVEAAEYVVTLTLPENGNYAFTGTQTAFDFTVEYKFTVNRSAITVWAENADVQYGAPVTVGGAPILYDFVNDVAAGEYFGGFKAVYGYYTSDNDTRPVTTNSDLTALIIDNAADGYFGLNFTAAGYASSAAAGAKFAIDVNATAHNFDVKRIVNASANYKAELTVVPRRISLDIFDVTESELDALTTAVYNNGLENWDSDHEKLLNSRFNAELEKFAGSSLSNDLLYGNSGDSELSDLAIKLNIGNVSDAGEYPVSLSNNRNYAISYYRGGALYGEPDVVMYKINKAVLYVKVHNLNSDGYNNGKETLEVVYGDNISQETSGKYKVISKGWLNGDTSVLLNGKTPSVTFKTADGKTYAPYEGHVGEAYSARADYAEELKNYIIRCEQSYLSVVPRTISVSDDCFKEKGVKLTDRMYAAESGDYHDGYYGLARPALISFVGWNSGIGSAEAANANRPEYKDSYNTVDMTYKGVKFQNAGEAPRRADDYKATVTLAVNGLGYNDYLFAGGKASVTYDYTVTKRIVSVDWELKIIDDENIKDNYVREYCASVMDRLAFTLNTVEVAVTPDNLIINETGEGLKFTPTTALGTYRMIIVFKDTATDNYCWDGFDVQAIIEFNVNGEGLAFIKNVVMSGWTFGDAAVTPTAELRTKNGDAITDASVRFEFVRLDTDDASLTEGGIEAGDLNDLDISDVFTSSVPINAGAYVMRARFDGNMSYHAANPVYYLFRVSKKTVAAIESSIETEYAELNGEVNITATIFGFDTDALTVVSSDVQTRVESVTENGVTSDNLVLTADRIRPSGFSVVFKLASSDNYEYEGEMTNGRIFVTWTVVASDDNTVDFDENNVYTYTYGDTYALNVNTHFTVGNIVEYSFLETVNAVKTETGAYLPVSGHDWHGGLPEHAGKYVVRAVSRNENNSYNTAFAYRELTIDKATLTVRADGTAVYGALSGADDAAAYSGFAFTDADGELKNSDTQKALRDEIAQNIKYVVNGVPNGVWDAKEYALDITAATSDYEIVCVTGVFAVTKATLNVAIDNNAWSYYGRPFDFSGATITVSGLISADVEKEPDYINAIREKFAVDADENSGAGSYSVTVKGFEDVNYSLRVTAGVYTVRKLPVTVVMNDGGYYYGNTPVLPSVAGVYDGETQIVGFDADLITVVFADHSEAPVNAGRYGYSVSLAADADYELAAPVSGIFEIFQITLDPSLIEFETVYYDGSVKAPAVVGVKDDAYGVNEFEVSYDGDWTNAGVAYTIVLTLKNTDNTKWLMNESAEQRVAYTISRGSNSLVAQTEGGEPAVTITGWTYGKYSPDVNLPSAKTKFGSDKIVYEYSADGEIWFRDIESRNAGDYFVRAVVYETTDYEAFYSEPVKFTISPVKLAAPVLNVVSSGENKNDTYTAFELGFDVTGVDFELMNVVYDGSVRLNGNNVTVYATAAGNYTLRISIKNANYAWADGVKTDDKGNALLEWTVKKQQIAVPTHNNATFIINGTLLEYLPVGFDKDLMSIDGNRAAYGGTFTATVTLTDTENYEWADGTVGAVTFTWKVVGANTVFNIIISVLAGLCAAAAISACVLFVRYRKREKAGAVASAGGGSGEAKAENAEKSENSENTENVKTDGNNAEGKE